jgi:hypothetical protein
MQDAKLKISESPISLENPPYPPLLKGGKDGLLSLYFTLLYNKFVS